MIIELVAAARAVFVLPDRPAGWLDEQPLRVADAVGKDLGPGIGAADERIVRRDRPIVVQPQDLPLMRAEILRGRLLMPLADGHVNGAVQTERDARAAVAAGRTPGISDEEIAHRRDRPTLEPRARERCRVAPLARLRVREVDGPVLREARMEGEIHEPVLRPRIDRRDAARMPAALRE